MTARKISPASFCRTVSVHMQKCVTARSGLELGVKVLRYKLQPNCSRPLIVPSVSNGNRTATDRRQHDSKNTLRTNAATSSLLAKPTLVRCRRLKNPLSYLDQLLYCC
jgi:hypothetical protein